MNTLPALARTMRLPWSVRATTFGSIYLADKDGRTIAWESQIMARDPITPTQILEFMAETANLFCSLPEDELEEIRDRNSRYRTELRTDWKKDEIAEACYQTVLDCQSLLNAIAVRDSLIDDILKDAGKVPVDSIPTETVRHHNRVYKTLLQKTVELLNRLPSSLQENCRLLKDIQTTLRELKPR